MTFTFDATSSSQTDLHKVRQRIGDVTSTDAMLTDEQITALLSDYDDWREAAFRAVDLIVAKLARTPSSRSAASLSATTALLDTFKAIKSDLKRELYSTAAPVLVGPNEISTKDSLWDNTDKEHPIQKRGTFTNSQD